MEISGVLSSSSRTALSKLCPRQRDLIPDFFLRVSRYSASSFADVSSAITLPFREEFVSDSRDIRLAFSTEPFHFCFFEAIFAYHAFENSKKKLQRTLLSFQTFSRYASSINTYSDSLGCFRKEVGDWDERLPSRNIRWPTRKLLGIWIIDMFEGPYKATLMVLQIALTGKEYKSPTTCKFIDRQL